MSGQDEALVLDFAGEIHRIPRDQAFTIGREGDLALDDNPFLHRRFLVLQWQSGLWWVVNVGSRLGTTVAEAEGSSRSWVAPGARVPLVFPRMALVFTAGATTYEILLEVPGPLYEVNPPEPGPSQGETTVGQVSLTPSQHLLILSLAEPWLRRTGTGPVDLPRNADAAARLARALSPGTEPTEQAEWIEGFLSGEILLLSYDPQLLRILDQWVRRIGDRAFVDVLPALRRAFSQWPGPQLQDLARQVATLGEDEEPQDTVDDLADAGPILKTVSTILGGAS